MKRYGLCALIMMLFIASPGDAGAGAYKYGYVNGSRLIALHPLMRQFDPLSRRFRNTISQPRPSENPAEYIQRLQALVAKQIKLIAELDANYAERITGQGMAARKAWWSFWKRRESMKISLTLLQEAIKQAALHGNFYLNMPSDWSLMPVAMAISSTIRDVCEYLRVNSELDVVLDTSVFIQNEKHFASPGFIPNRHWQIWRKESLDANELQEIGFSLKESVTGIFPELAHRPFVAGAVNLNSSAVPLLRDITLQSSELPGDSEK
ncbi:MAG: hypothetical protein PHV05_02070 [Candidatus Riflebacteria bacterium]|nr:hypothetical protein [Candidatus Riflebacteria bacterium]